MKHILFAGALALALASVTSCTEQAGHGQPAPGGQKLIGARVQIKADKLEQFLAAAKSVIAASRAEAGNISYTLYQDPYERTVFFFFEEWKDQAAIDFHFKTPHFTAFGIELRDLAAGPAAITIYGVSGETKPGG